MMNSSGIKPEAVEQLGNTLRRDYRNLKRAILDEDPDACTRSFVSKLGRTVEDTIKMLDDLSK
jgi:hypothetical protein